MPLDLELNLAPDYKDGKITVEQGDFKIVNGQFRIIPTSDTGLQVGQRLHVRLLLRRGEVFFNTQAGFPYSQLSKFKGNTNLFDSYLKSYILDTVGVTALAEYNSDVNNGTRKASVKFGTLTTSGEVLNVQKEIPV